MFNMGFEKQQILLATFSAELMGILRNKTWKIAESQAQKEFWRFYLKIAEDPVYRWFQPLFFLYRNISNISFE